MTCHFINIVYGTSPTLCGSCQNEREGAVQAEPSPCDQMTQPIKEQIGFSLQKDPCLNTQGTCLQMTDLFQVPATCPLL